MKTRICLFAAFALIIETGFGQRRTHLDSIVISKMNQLHLSGAAICAIDSGKIKWTKYFGYQNIEKKIPVSSSTLFQIASVSKTVTASAIAQLVSRQKINLDKDINFYLPFKVRNPHFPEVPITIGELLRHRSSIVDNPAYYAPLWAPNQGDTKTSLKSYLQDYLVPGGAHYDPVENFMKLKPNMKFRYSNTGYALLGLIVESVSGLPFPEYCKRNIFQPLSMNNAGWFLKDVDVNKLAMPYHYNDSIGQYQAYGHNGYPDYPAGTLRTTAEELAHFLIAWTTNGKWQNHSVYDSATIQLFTPRDMALGSYNWFIGAMAFEDGQLLVYRHGGGDNGVATAMYFDPSGRGLIVFFNSVPDDKKRASFNELLNVIYKNIR